MMKSITISLVAIISAAAIGCASETAEEEATNVDVKSEVSPNGGPPGPRMPGTPGCPYGCDGYGNPFPPPQPPPPPPPCTPRIVCGVFGPGCVVMCS